MQKSYKADSTKMFADFFFCPLGHDFENPINYN